MAALAEGVVAVVVLIPWLLIVLSQLFCWYIAALPTKAKSRRFPGIPDWRLFAPEPVYSDLHLVIRDADVGWRQRWSPAEPTPMRALWNPDRRMAIVLRQAEADILDAARHGREPDAISVACLHAFAASDMQPASYVAVLESSCGPAGRTVFRLLYAAPLSRPHHK